MRASVRKLLRPRRARLAPAALLLAATAIGLVAPRLIGELVDRVLAGEPASAMTAPAVGMLVVAAGAGVFDALGRAQAAAVGEPVLADLREDVVGSALGASPEVLERAGRGDLLSRVSGDSEAVSELVSEALPALVRAGLTIGLTVGGLALLDWRLALAALVVAPVQIWALRWYLRRTGPMYAAERAAEVADPLVAVLDEATAEGRQRGRRTLESAAAAALAGRTALVVAHRLTQAAAADRVLVLDRGRVVEQARHADLLAAGGPYATLWAAWSQNRGP